jgi:DAK2 domain fusion protein YloV
MYRRGGFFMPRIRRDRLNLIRSADSASGKDLLEMLTAGTDRLQHYASNIDSLNVFPVPDGDTGNNMLFSMRAALEEARGVSEDSASEVAEAFARGALIGARGNSGIILSQFWQGLAQGIDGNKSINAADLAASMRKAAVLAFQALSKPVEGTILTVIKDIAAATRLESTGKDDLVSFMERVVNTARESVARTPQQLQILREAGVVDAGGWGLQIILEGVLSYLRSDREDSSQHQLSSTGMRTDNPPPKTVSQRMSYGYCTEFLLRGNDLDPDKIRAVLEDRGESLVVAGNERMMRVHLHTEEPDAAVLYARSLGQVDHLNIRDMDEQHEAFLQGWTDTRREAPGEDDVAVYALVPGEGLAAVFGSLGAESVVVDEQNPGEVIEELRKAVETRPDCRVLILPNSPNLLSAAEELFESASRRVSIVPTLTIPQGISAVLAHNPGEGFETNSRLMAEAIGRVRTIEIYEAAHHSDSEGDPHMAAPYVGLLEGELSASGEDAWTVLDEMVGALDTDDAELITIYYSANTAGNALEAVSSNLHRTYPHLEVETVPAGRLRADFIVSLE